MKLYHYSYEFKKIYLSVQIGNKEIIQMFCNIYEININSIFHKYNNLYTDNPMLSVNISRNEYYSKLYPIHEYKIDINPIIECDYFKQIPTKLAFIECNLLDLVE